MTEKELASMTKLVASLPKDYSEFLGSLKEEISNARIKAVLSVNKELVLLYWKIGKRILDNQKSVS
jgi:hypothetical protein